MRFLYYLKIAFINIKKKSIYLKIMFSYFIIMLFLLVFLLSVFVINNTKKSLLDLQRENCNAQLIAENYSNVETFPEEYIKETFISVSISSGYSISNIQIDGVSMNKKMMILGEMVDYKNVFPKSIMDSYLAKNKKDIVIGELPKNNDEILINEAMVYNLGYDCDYILGEKISLSYERKTGRLSSKEYIINVTITGIIRNDFLDFDEENYIIISNDISLENFPNKEIYNLKSITIYFNDYKDISLKIDEINEKYGLTFRATNLDAIDLYNKFELYGQTLIEVFSIFVIIIILSFFIFVLSLAYMEYCNNIRQYQVMYCYGLTKKTINLIVFLQHFLVYFVSFILSSIFSTFVILLIIEKLSDLSSGILIFDMIKALPIYFISFLFGIIFVGAVITLISKPEKKGIY